MERQPSVDETVNALHGGILSIAPSAAVSTIDGWQAQLAGSDQPALQGIARDLGELKRHLTGGNLDGRAIGEVLVRLGDQTSAAAANADATKQAKLQQLGQLLSSAGRSLS